VLAAISDADRRDVEKRAAALEGGTAAPRTWERFEATSAPVDEVDAVAAAVRHLHAAGDDDGAAARLRHPEDLLWRRGAAAEALVLAESIPADLVSLRARLCLRLGRVADARALAPTDAAIGAEIALESGDLAKAEELAPKSARALATRLQ